ncbi:MAG: hypothetical protein Q9157_000795 [Trypethelium eluteriae]
MEGRSSHEAPASRSGFGGLTAAIECHRQGHDVEVYEAFPELKILGDIISFGPNAGRIFRRWSDGKIADRMRALSIDLTNHGFHIHKWTGELITVQKTPPRDPEAPVFNGHRGELHEVVFRYARDELGIPIHLGRRVKAYFEEEEAGEAGVLFEDGGRAVGDVVVGSDGDTFQGWIGPDVHFLFSTIKNGTDCCWVLTHKDEADIEESWSFPGKLEEVFKVIDGYDPICRAIVEKTPPERLVDWKLVYRDPLPRWVSEKGRIVLLGDSAHPFLPTSAQGATQSMEDGVVLAVCLRRGGKNNVATATRSYEEMRYATTETLLALILTRIQVRSCKSSPKDWRDNKVMCLLGDMWHKADWDKVKEDPESMHMPREGNNLSIPGPFVADLKQTGYSSLMRSEMRRKCMARR